MLSRSTDDEGLTFDRVQRSPQIDLGDLQCGICWNILWKPLSCQSCETPLCSTCMNTSLTIHPNQCPMRCNPFISRPSSRFIRTNLAQFQITCAYQSNGCPELRVGSFSHSSRAFVPHSCFHTKSWRNTKPAAAITRDQQTAHGTNEEDLNKLR